MPVCRDCSYVGSWHVYSSILRGFEDTKALPEDGASAELLEHLLVPFSQEIRTTDVSLSSFPSRIIDYYEYYVISLLQLHKATKSSTQRGDSGFYITDDAWWVQQCASLRLLNS
jgi:hypothetical protein